MSGRLQILLLSILLGSGVTQNLQAIVLDWSNLTWTAGALTQSYDIDPTNPGNDVTITISGNTGKLGGGYPAINNSLNGATGDESLAMQLNFNQNSQSILVTVTFNYAWGVNGVAFDLFGIDTAANGTDFIDQISSLQSQFGTNVFGPASIIGSANNAVSGSGISQTIIGTAPTPDSSGAGNATVEFGTNGMTQFSFVYGNDPASKNNPGQQTFALYNIAFTNRAPELHPAIAAFLVCALACAARWINRHATD